MLQVHNTTIDGYQLKVTQLPLGISRPMFFKLTKICGPAVVGFLKNLDGKDLKSVALPVLADAIAEVIANVDYATFDAFMLSFAQVTEIIGADGSNTLLAPRLQTDAFNGNYATLMKWFAYSLDINFSSFLAGLGLTVPRGA